jgi:small-conductance mechanosensitive channel
MRGRIIAWLGMVGLFLGYIAAVPAAPSVDASASLAELEPATLVVFNRPVVTFRAALFGAAPAERVTRAQQLIAEELDRGGSLPVEVQANPLGQFVLLGHRLVFIVVPGDADALAAESASIVAAHAADALRQAVSDTREASNLHALWRTLLRAAAATLVLAAVLWGMARLQRRLAGMLLRLSARKAGLLHIGSIALMDGRQLAPFLVGLLRLLCALLSIVFAYRWLSFVLLCFPYTRPWGEALDGYFLRLVGGLFANMADAVPGIGVALAIFLLARMFVVLSGHVLERMGQAQLAFAWLGPDTLPTTRRLMAFGIWLFAVAMAYPYLPGAQTEAFKGLSVLLGLMVTLGASSLVGQCAAGLILTYTATFRPGEYVRIGEHEGTVIAMGMFTTRIRTGQGEELTMPNSLITASVTRNFSRVTQGDGYVVETSVSIGYDTPWRQVEAMLIEAAQLTPGIVAQPAPQVFQTALSDFYPVYRLVAQSNAEQPRPRAEVLSNLHANIQDVFNRYGVQIMSPHYMNDCAAPKLVGPDGWRPPPAGGGAS